ncbi:MAG: type II toxin-antitoxin system VapC family toxin [Gammaproteobacteria bacterium]|nr:type II toxin-antitoxin system VapC family toxin [Gammaproteobacteria bacterium]
MIVLDTHVLVWWVAGETKNFSRKARQALEQHGRRNELLISSISIFEIVTLERRGRLRFRGSASEWLDQVRLLPEYRIEPLTADIAERAGRFGEAFPGDPADRLIAATALVRGVPLVTHDEKLQGIEQLKTVW